MRTMILQVASALLCAMPTAAAQLPDYVKPDARLALAWPSNQRVQSEVEISLARDGSLLFNAKEFPERSPLYFVRIRDVAYSTDSTRITIRMRGAHPERMVVRRDAARQLSSVLRGSHVVDSMLAERDRTPPLTLRVPYQLDVAAIWRANTAVTETFREQQWLVVGPMVSDSVWNSNVLTMADRVSRSAQGSVLSTLRIISEELPANAHGVALRIGIRNTNLAESASRRTEERDETVWYVTQKALRELEDAEVSLGKFFEQVIVLVNGVRVDVDLRARAR